MATVRQVRGKWCADWRDDTGRRFIKPCADEPAAYAYLAQVTSQLQKGTFLAPDQLPTFKAVAADWLAERAERVSVATIAGYQVHLDLHLVPILGEHRIDQIRVRHLEAFCRNRLAAKLAPQTVNKFLTTAADVFNYAVRHEYIDRNPVDVVPRCRRVVAAKSVKALAELAAELEDGAVDPTTVLSAEQARTVIAQATPGMYQTFLHMAVLTGGRVGELTSLIWDDIDLTKGEVRIARSVTWAHRRDEPASGPTYKPPKTSAGKRRIPLRPELVAALRRWKLACPPTADGWVFPSSEGTPVHRSTLAHKALHPACDAAGVKRVRLHSLRHTFASTLLMAGRADTEVAALCGHKDSSVTRRVYAHWLRAEHDPSALASLDGIAADAAKG
ncbi:site-specific integrase [bacterium]|nr:site-specific integrase [bacterium]